MSSKANTLVAAGAATTAVPGQVANSTTLAPAGDGVCVRYVGIPPLSLTGPKSGRVYRFAGTGVTALVDVADLDAMLGTRLFVHHRA